MPGKRLVEPLLLIMLLTTGMSSAGAEETFRFVQIREGIDQRRPPNDRQTIGRRYVWNFQNTPYTLLVAIAVEQYNSYAGMERTAIPQLVEEGSEAVAALTREFRRILSAHPEWSKREAIDFVLSFVQALPYTSDEVTTGYDEFRRYAVETLIEGGGDCEDTTILAAAILRGLGESVALMTTPGHIALGISGDLGDLAVPALPYNGTNYYYCETTGTGWTVGQIPDPVMGQPVTITPLGSAHLPSKRTPTPTVVRPVPQPTPSKPPEPAVPKPTSNGSSPAGAVMIGLFLLLVFGAPVVYLLWRLFHSADDNSNSDDPDAPDPMEPSERHILDE